MESIFSKIKSYTPTMKRDSKEDYLTEIFAFILQNIEGLSNSYCEFLMGKANNINILNAISNSEQVNVDTQYAVESGRIDLLIQYPGYIFICEHKIYSSLSYNQINKYYNDLKKISNDTIYTVLITASKLQHTQKANVKLVWGDICKFLEGFLKNNEKSINSVNQFLLVQVIGYLKEQGLGLYEAIEGNEIISCFVAQNLKNKLKEVFLSLAQDNWKADFNRFKMFQRKDYNPQFQDKWGRMGINFFDNWTPGIFAGVILDTSDHKIEPKDYKLGPDLVIIIDIANPKERFKFQGKKEFQDIVSILNKNCGSFELIDKELKNKYRLLCLKKPLISVIKGKYTIDEQRQSIKEEIIKGIEFLLENDLLFDAFK